MTAQQPHGVHAPDEGSGERRAYASPVCHASEFELETTVPPGIYRAIVEHAAEAIIFTHRDGKIRLWNQGAERLFGYSAAEALGASLDLFIPQHLRHAHWQGFRLAIETGQLHGPNEALTTRPVHKDGRKLYVAEFRLGAR